MLQEECEKWPFRSSIYNLKAREWPGKEVLGAWTPGANEALELGFSIPVRMLVPWELLHSRWPVLVSFCPLWGLRIPHPRWRETHCAALVSCQTFTQEREFRCITVLSPACHWACCHYEYKGMELLLWRHMLHSQGSYFKRSESLWQNKHRFFRCGNYQVSSWCINWPQGWNLLQQVVYVRLKIGISQITRQLYNKFFKKTLLCNAVVVVLCAPKLEDDFMNPRAVLTDGHWIHTEFYLILTLVP